MPRRFARGSLLVLGLFAVGGAMLWGLFLAPRPSSPAAPAGVGWGVPGRTLRFVSYNVLHNQRGIENVVAAIKPLDADFVLLQEAESRHATDLARALGMTQTYHPRLYERSANLAGPRATWGNLILSRHPMYDAGPIPNPGGGSFGVWAVAVIEDKKFLLANVHLSATWNANPKHLKESGVNRHKELTALRDAWRARGSPPAVIGGDFNQIPMGNNYALMTERWTDALGALGQTGSTFGEGLLRTRIDYFLITDAWKPLGGGIIAADASDHRPIWVDLSPAAPPTAAAPPAPVTTSPAR
ncbi:MAG TPA: endonuclease/exonuclease/phosphatase family protein [Tepidisphaeraceae bacterium]|nr:endonuclease/exonuclease/phosphatase family protein [Tepidisphaeraceae bacterium]